MTESYLEQRPLRPIRRDDRAVAGLGPEEGGELGALARLGDRAQLVAVLLGEPDARLRVFVRLQPEASLAEASGY